MPIKNIRRLLSGLNNLHQLKLKKGVSVYPDSPFLRVLGFVLGSGRRHDIRRLLTICLILLVLRSVSGAPGRHQAWADLQFRETVIPLSLYHLTTENVRIHILQNTEPYNLETNENYAGIIIYSLDEEDVDYHSITGSVATGTNYIDFAFTTNDLSRTSRRGKPYFGQLFLTNTSQTLIWNNLQLTVKPRIQ